MSAKKNEVVKGMGGEMGKVRGGPPGGRWSLQGEQVFIKWTGTLLVGVWFVSGLSPRKP